MNRASLDSRLRELGIYSSFYHRKELSALPRVLEEDEQLNCILTGVHDANRKMLAVTDRRILIVFAGALASGDITVIRRGAVEDWSFEKKAFFSNVSITTNEGRVFTFTNTQGGLRELFNWAMEQPVPGGEG